MLLFIAQMCLYLYHSITIKNKSVMESIHGQIDLSKIKSEIRKARKPDGTIIDVIVINLEENNLKLNGHLISFKDYEISK